MDDEFKLCWKNFQDNIASGFQNLYDRGDLVDVTLACDGKLLQAHKIVLAICSPYFQEIFTTNPCQHPIIILKDVSFNIMCELLEFMYQGVVNVKHTELQSFMKIGQLLQIKGLATNSNASPGSSASEKSAHQAVVGDDTNNSSSNHSNNNNNSKSEAEPHDASNKNISNSNNTQNNSRTPTPASPTGNPVASPLYASSKRLAPTDFNSEALSIHSRKQQRRLLPEQAGESGSEHVDNAAGAGMDNALNSDEFFMTPIPHLSMVESRYDLNSLKRESEAHQQAGSNSAANPSTMRNPFAPNFMDYNSFYKTGNSSSNMSGPAGGNNGNGLGVAASTEYPNELYMPSDYSKNFANHMDIPSNGSNMVMLSTTSLLHGNCVFNRNNTVATQQGMKTYWLCKSYRISMCRARCITHLGRIISATGVHNHLPHMRAGSSNSSSNNNNSSNGAPASGSNVATVTVTPNPNPGQLNYSISDVTQSAGSGSSSGGVSLEAHQPSAMGSSSTVRLGPTIFANQSTSAAGPVLTTSSAAHHPHHHHHHPHHHTHPHTLPNLVVQQHAAHSMDHHVMTSSPAPPNSVIQNMMHNPNLMHLSHTHHQHQQQDSPHHLELSAAGPSLLPISPAHMQQSPQSNRSGHSMHGNGSATPPPPSAAATQAVEANQQQQQQHVDLNESAGSTAHVIDSITISPGSGHNFKIENM